MKRSFADKKLTLYTTEEWKKMQEHEEARGWNTKKTQPEGKCICAGCDKRLRKRKRAITLYEHLADIEQDVKYCIECIQKGHSLVFTAYYVEGKRVISDEMLERGKKIQRKLHEIK